MNMKKLRKQIRESFFNPILHLLPLLLFLVFDEIYGIGTAWIITAPIVVTSVFYVYFVYTKIFNWHLILTSMFLGISFVASVEVFLSDRGLLSKLVYELVAISFLSFLIIFRNKIQKSISGLLSKLIPMKNNFDEMYKVIWVLFFLLTFYIGANFLLYQIEPDRMFLYSKLLRDVYVGLIIFFVVYEILRVQIIRTKLFKEEWWPIVSNQGKIIGSIHHLTSLAEDNKYMHPIARVVIVDKGRILLQKHNDSSILSGLWDVPISNHIKVDETIDQCVERTALKLFDLAEIKYMYLSKYFLENENEIHYAFLYVTCFQQELMPKLISNDQTKWWTQQQIEANLNLNIFSKNFIIEYNLLQRSGLLESEKCECSCKLKDVIYQLD